MLGSDLFDLASGKRFERFAGWLELCCQAKCVHEPIGQEQHVGSPIASKFLNYVNFLWIDTDCEVRRQSPWRSCPNRDACFAGLFAACDFLRTSRGESPPDSLTTLYSMGRP